MTRGTTAPPITPEMYREVFEEHPTGRLVLEHLIVKFTRPAVTDGGIDAVLKTYMRQGQRAPLDYIVTQMNRANGVTSEGESSEIQE
jgi:hypothetical protein